MIGMMLVAGLVLAVVIAKRRAAVGLDVDELGCLSDHWVAAHRADSP